MVAELAIFEKITFSMNYIYIFEGLEKKESSIFYDQFISATNLWRINQIQFFRSVQVKRHKLKSFFDVRKHKIDCVLCAYNKSICKTKKILSVW